MMQQEYQNGFSDDPNASAVITSDSEITILWSTTVSIYCFGGLIGGCLAGVIADKIGRKRLMMLANILPIVASVTMFSCLWGRKFELIIAGRFVAGIHGGVSTVVGPMYLNEVSPLSLRGVSGILNQLIIVLALGFAQLLGLSELLGTRELFYYILGIPVIPALLHWVLLFFCPESPAWIYLHKKDSQSAREALESLRSSPVDGEMDLYHQAETEQASQPKVTLKDMFTTFRARPLVVVIFMHLSQQLAGTNGIIFYSTSIFENAHLNYDEAQYGTVGLSGVQLVMTFVSMLLIERLGRRTLHLHGLGGMFLSETLVTLCLVLKEINGLGWISYGSLIFSCFYFIAFSIGPGSIPWFYTTELFDSASATWALSIGVAVNWTANFAVGLLFPSLQKALNVYTFLPFMVLIAIFWIVLYKTAPETKGRCTLEVMAQFKSLHDKHSLPKEERRQYQTFG